MDYSQDLVMMKGGQMILINSGEMLTMENEAITPDGVQVYPDGTLLLPDGTPSVLTEGEALVVDLVLSRLTG